VHHPTRLTTPLVRKNGELTEATLANLVLRQDGEWVTPPVESGLLAGTLRAELLDRGRIVERVLRPDDLARAENVYLINSVRGWMPARLVGQDGPDD
jgi:para-aminobenzoate synthetase/4-amino-4-deoxychorismate lyase